MQLHHDFLQALAMLLRQFTEGCLKIFNLISDFPSFFCFNIFCRGFLCLRKAVPPEIRYFSEF